MLHWTFRKMRGPSSSLKSDRSPFGAVCSQGGRSSVVWKRGPVRQQVLPTVWHVRDARWAARIDREARVSITDASRGRSRVGGALLLTPADVPSRWCP